MPALLFCSLIHFQLTFTQGWRRDQGSGKRNQEEEGQRQCGTRAVKDMFPWCRGVGSTGAYMLKIAASYTVNMCSLLYVNKCQ